MLGTTSIQIILEENSKGLETVFQESSFPKLEKKNIWRGINNETITKEIGKNDILYIIRGKYGVNIDIIQVHENELHYFASDGKQTLTTETAKYIHEKFERRKSDGRSR